MRKSASVRCARTEKAEALLRNGIVSQAKWIWEVMCTHTHTQSERERESKVK